MLPEEHFRVSEADFFSDLLQYLRGLYVDHLECVSIADQQDNFTSRLEDVQRFCQKQAHIAKIFLDKFDVKPLKTACCSILAESVVNQISYVPDAVKICDGQSVIIAFVQVGSRSPQHALLDGFELP